MSQATPPSSKHAAVVTAAMQDATTRAAPAIVPLPSRTRHSLRSAVVLSEPSQAMHELIANALDAGATRVSVVIDLVRLAFTVSDNGSGMTLEDLRRIGQRHVSSKCDGVDDLSAGASARTIGWRGEALSSLAHLCDLEIQTRPRDRTQGGAAAALEQQPNSKRRRVETMQHLADNAFASAAAASSSAIAAAAPSVARSASSSSSGTYTKLIRQGEEMFCGFASTHRSEAGSTVSLANLYASMPVRAKLLQEDKARTREREKLKRRLMRLALVHPHVEFALHDAAIPVHAGAVATRTLGKRHGAAVAETAHVSSKHYFRDSTHGERAPGASAPVGASSTSLHMPLHLSQRIWHKPPSSSLLANFHTIFGAAAAAASGGAVPALDEDADSVLSPSQAPSLGVFSLEHSSLPQSLVELPRFAPRTPEATTPATTACLRSMRVSGFLSHPARLFLFHRDLQFIFVNRHFVQHRELQRTVEAMYERVARVIPAVREAMGVSEGAEGSPEASAAKRAPRGGGSTQLQRGSIKTRGAAGSSGGGPNPAKQGRRRYPTFLLHLELPASEYDILFDPDKSTVQFAQRWAVTDGVTQALRHWLFALYPALAAMDASLFPPTYMPQWLQRRTDDDDGGEVIDLGVALQDDAARRMRAPVESHEYPASAAMLASNSWAASMSSSPHTPLAMPFHFAAQEGESKEAEPSDAHSPARAVPGRSAASFTRLPTAGATSAAASTNVPSTSSDLRTHSSTLRPERLHFEEQSASAMSSALSLALPPRASHTALAPTFHSSFAHSAAAARPSRSPDAFLARATPAAARTVSTRPSRHHAVSVTAPPAPNRSRAHESAAAPSASRSTVLNIARSGVQHAPVMRGELQQYSAEPAEDAFAEWTGGNEIETRAGSAAAAVTVDAAPMPLSSTQVIRCSVPSKERLAGEDSAPPLVIGEEKEQFLDNDPAPTSCEDAALWQDFIFSPPGIPAQGPSAHTAAMPAFTPPKRKLSALLQDAAAASASARRTRRSFTGGSPISSQRTREAPFSATSSHAEAASSSLQLTVKGPNPPLPSRDAMSAGCCSHDGEHHLAHASPRKQHALAAPANTLAPPLSPDRPHSPLLRALSPHPSLSPSPPPAAAHPFPCSWLPTTSSTGGATSSSSLHFRPLSLDRAALSSVRLIGQLDNKFLLVRAGGLILAVDQHAADERRRLEFLQAHVERYAQAITLLQAAALPISGAEETVLRTHEAEISAWGFRFRLSASAAPVSSSPRSGAALLSRSSAALVSSRVLLLSVPLVCGVELDVDDFREYLQQLRDTKPLRVTATHAGAATPLSPFLARTPRPVQRILNYKACRSAVMFGDPLPVRTQRAIMAGVLQCSYPFNCAHGRPTMTPIVHVQPLQDDADAQDELWSPDVDAELKDMLR